jgi:hypothetical protein
MIATSSPSEPIIIRQDIFDHLPRMHRIAAEMMIERGELKIVSEDDDNDR